MDLKLKGIAWVGNMCQKFETICHEMDNIVSQDAVKYVENQVQAVGENVKRFCTDVVQDLIPPMVDPVKCEVPAVALNRNANIGLDNVVPLENETVNAFSEHHPNESTTPACEDPLEHAESGLAPDNIDSLTDENSDVATEETAAEEKSSAEEVLEPHSSGEGESQEASLLSEFINCNHENTCRFLDEVSPATSLHGEELQSSENVERLCNNFADGFDLNSDASGPLSSLNAFQVGLYEKPILETDVGSSYTSIMTGFPNLSESSLNNLHNTEEPYINPVNVGGSQPEFINIAACPYSSKSAPAIYRKNKGRDMTTAFNNSSLSWESIGSSDDFGYRSDDLTELETVSLSDMVNLEESCVIVDDSMLYEVSRRTRKLRSYKDAITSRRRLAKEYEQLAIWYGEVDEGHSRDKVQSHLSPSTTVTLEPDPQTHKMHDYEWEFL
uniref:Uncharacterized protein n=1 Tax=Rhizophora mucronata TaxID=61149 RepID=A0A2P2KSJ5_RHIMU